MNSIHLSAYFIIDESLYQDHLLTGKSYVCEQIMNVHEVHELSSKVELQKSTTF